MLRKSYYIEMDIKLLELYSDYIISSFGQITATGLSKALGGSIRHGDKSSYFLQTLERISFHNTPRDKSKLRNKKMKSIKKKIAYLIIPLLLSSSCQSSQNSSNKDSLKLGTLLPLTGEMSAYGMSMQDTAQLLVDTVNACGGVLGQPVTLVFEDDQSVPQVASEAMSKLAEVDQVSGIIGGAGSASSAAAVDIAVRNQVIMISPSSTSPSFTERAKKGDFNGYWFRTAPPDTFQGSVIAKLALSKGYKKISILAVNNEYGRGLGNAFISAFESSGGKITQKSFYAPNTITFDSEVLDAYKESPDAVLLIDYSQTGGIILSSIYQQGFINKAPIILSDGLKDAELAQKVGKTSDGDLVLTTFKSITGTAPSAKGPAFTAFRSLYQKTYRGKEPSIYDANTWDAGAVMILGSEAAKSTKSNDIKENIRKVSNSPGEEVSDVCQALKLIQQSKKINYEGAGSDVDFDSQGDIGGNYDVWTIEADGNIKTIDVIEFKSHPD
jgi:ABC-type branched-subunit amino acid transport system substrate-binding protein